MRIHLRGDDVRPLHTTVSVFMNGGLCGVLTFRNDEAVVFRDTVGRGCVNEAFQSTGSWPDRAGIPGGR